MSSLQQLYRTKLSLLTDLYQITMAYGYWEQKIYDRPAVFHLFFRKNPFKGNYAIACGLQLVIDYLQSLKFERDDIQYLAQLKGADGQTLFDESFLNYLQRLEFSCDVDAIPEGTVVFPNEPLIRVKGPLLQAQLIETALLNLVNFSTLIATKSSRIVAAAAGDAVLEFGLRRAQGIDGGVSASRAAYIGGCTATSNLLAGRLYDIPVKGTHAHSWIMAYEEEQQAFDEYAQVLPNNCIFLVDTYDTLEGVKKAIRTGNKLREKGHDLLGIRLDSGDLTALSIAARALLDEAGFPNAQIVASNNLDEYAIARLKKSGARIDVWGVGTRLATASDQPALGGVYKLAALADATGNWSYKIKRSEQRIKTSNPGIQQVRRRYRQGKIVGDLIYDPFIQAGANPTAENWEMDFDREEDLLVPVFEKGKLVYASPNINDIRQRTNAQLATLTAEPISVDLDKRLAAIKNELIGTRV